MPARKFVALSLVAGTLGVTSQRFIRAQGYSRNELVTCDTSIAFAKSFRDRLVAIDTASDARAVAFRTSMSLPMVQVNEIRFVADSTVCARAARAHAVRVNADTLTPAPVWVVRIGSNRYITFDGSQIGDYFLQLVFDSTFQYVAPNGGA